MEVDGCLSGALLADPHALNRFALARKGSIAHFRSLLIFAIPRHRSREPAPSVRRASLLRPRYPIPPRGLRDLSDFLLRAARTCRVALGHPRAPRRAPRTARARFPPRDRTRAPPHPAAR